jgi:hypothetical protein
VPRIWAESEAYDIEYDVAEAGGGTGQVAVGETIRLLEQYEMRTAAEEARRRYEQPELLF